VLKRIISFLFNPSVPEALLGLWALIWLPVLKLIRIPRLGIFVLGLGVKLHKMVNSYWTFWLCYYLRRDTRWDATRVAMKSNPFCPDSLILFYRDLLFEAEPAEVKEIFDVLPWSQRVTDLYRFRQERCGFKALV